MRVRREGPLTSVTFGGSGDNEDYGWAGIAVRFLVNVAALWLAQQLIRGFDIDGAGALVFGALIFGVLNAVLRPVIALVSLPVTCLTLGAFTLIINTLMLALTAWVAGWFDLAFDVDGFIAASWRQLGAIRPAHFLEVLVTAAVCGLLPFGVAASSAPPVTGVDAIVEVDELLCGRRP